MTTEFQDPLQEDQELRELQGRFALEEEQCNSILLDIGQLALTVV